MALTDDLRCLAAALEHDGGWWREDIDMVNKAADILDILVQECGEKLDLLFPGYGRTLVSDEIQKTAEESKQMLLDEEFWRHIRKAQRIVDRWPEWKRNILEFSLKSEHERHIADQRGH